MVQKIGPEETNVVLKFGGGLHTRASPDEIDPREAYSGQNFMIDIQNRNLVARPPFDLIGQVPNAASIRGGATLLKRDGTVSTIFQAGGVIYEWSSPANTFTQVGTCSASCQLRGHWKSHVWNLLPEVVLITDLNLTDPVYSWDGTTFAHPTFTDQNNNPFGNFFAKYASVQNERAFWANVSDSGGALPHVMVGSQTSDYDVIDTTDQPSSSAGTGDPFFIPMPDLHPINSFVQTYLGTMISTQMGAIFNLTGTDSTNFAFSTFYSNSAASGPESLCEIGNDFIYGRQGRIESVRDTDTFGNSEAADLTAIIADQVAAFNGWTIVFNGRTRKAYCFPTGESQVWVLDAAIRDAGELNASGAISPWMRWTTLSPLAFQPTMVMSMLDPNDGLEYIMMGDSSGNIYRMEGTGTGDAGSYNIDMQFLSKLMSGRLDAMVYDCQGYVRYFTQQTGSTLTLTFKWQGENIFSNTLTVPLSAAPSGQYWNGGAHWNDGSVWGEITGQLTRTKFSMPGNQNEFQVLVEVDGTAPVSINEIGIRMRAASR